MPTFRRYVAIGDSSTEGLVDPDGQGGYRGWADRLAQQIADGQDEPLAYANLAIRGLRIGEILATQLEPALAMDPDLMTIFGGVNDILGWSCDLEALRDDYATLFGRARDRGATVLTFTMPDASRFNPFGPRLRERIDRLDDVIRAEADRFGALVLDFQLYPVAEDPRLWWEDRLHGNALGHERVAAALAWRLGIAGSDLSWSDLLPDEQGPRIRERVGADLDWAVHHFGPWLGKSIRRIPHGAGVTAKRPTLVLVPRSDSRDHPEPAPDPERRAG